MREEPAQDAAGDCPLAEPGLLTEAAGHGRDGGYPVVLVAPRGTTAAHTLEHPVADQVLPVVDTLDDAHTRAEAR